MFEDLEAAKKVLREIDGHLAIGNYEAVREKVTRAIGLIDHYENDSRTEESSVAKGL